MTTLATVRRLVAEVLELEVEDLDVAAHLFKDLKVDSILLVDLLTELEREFKVAVPDARAKKEFVDVRSIAAVVDELLAARGA